MRRLVCRIFGHDWTDWQPAPISGWSAPGRDPELRYCHRCLTVEHDFLGRMIHAMMAAES